MEKQEIKPPTESAHGVRGLPRRVRLLISLGSAALILGIPGVFVALSALAPGNAPMVELPTRLLLPRLLYVALSLGLAGATWTVAHNQLKLMKLGLTTAAGDKITMLAHSLGCTLTVLWLLAVGSHLWVGGPLYRFLVLALILNAALPALILLVKMRVRSNLSRTLGLLLTATLVVAVVGVWWLITQGAPEKRVVQPLILPSPGEMLRAFVPLHMEQGLVRSIYYSWLRVTTGFGLAALVAVPLGVYMATFPPIAAFFRPLALTGAYVPIVVFIPLSMTWFGTGETQKIGFLFIGCFVALLPLVIKDIADVPTAFLDVAVTKGASQWQLVRHVLFPVAKANIWDHLRGVYGVGWGWIIMAEVFVQPEYGLGRLIEVSNRRSQTGAIFAVIVVIVLIAVACDQLWRLGGELLFPYRRKD
jgi:NitT/TauT family transport system permease protein